MTVVMKSLIMMMVMMMKLSRRFPSLGLENDVPALCHVIKKNLDHRKD